MSQEVSRRPITAETRVQVETNPRGICGGRSGKGFSPSTSFYPANNVPRLLYTHSFNDDRRYIILKINIVVKGRAMAQAVSRPPPTAEARVRSRVSTYGICGGQSGTGTGFSPEYFGFSPVNFIPPVLHY
jgi:hypothetical protein